MKGVMLAGGLGSHICKGNHLKPMIEIEERWKEHDYAAQSDAESASWRNPGSLTPPIPAHAPRDRPSLESRGDLQPPRGQLAALAHARASQGESREAPSPPSASSATRTPVAKWPVCGLLRDVRDGTSAQRKGTCHPSTLRRGGPMSANSHPHRAAHRGLVSHISILGNCAAHHQARSVQYSHQLTGTID